MDVASPQGAVSVPPDVLVQRLPGEGLVFLNLASEEYHGLDATGAVMWTALTETGRLDMAHERLCKEFDAEPEVLRRDLEALVRRLVGRGLLRVDGDAA